MKNSASGPNTAESARPVLARYFSARWAMPRGSRIYGSRVPVSAMVQVNDSVGTAIKGSIKAVTGSGIASMSEASMLFQPRMLEPSKPSPSAKDSSLSSLIGMLKCCQVPKVSTNLISTILAPLFLANSNTLLGVLIGDDCSVVARVYLRAPFGKQCACHINAGCNEQRRKTNKIARRALERNREMQQKWFCETKRG